MHNLAATLREQGKHAEAEGMQREVLAAHDLTLDDVVDVTCYLVDMRRDFEAFNSEYAAAFGVLDAPPTRTTMEVAQLPPGGRIAVELKVVARCDKGA